MNRTSFGSQNSRKAFAFFTLLLAFALALGIPSHAQTNLVKLSTDTFHNSDSEHRSEVEPDTFAWGSTIVSAFQVARVPGGGGADVGFATSTDGGKTWAGGYLPGLTDNYKGGRFTAASDAAVAYDVKHGVWLISTLPIINDQGEAVATSRSTDEFTGASRSSWIRAAPTTRTGLPATTLPPALTTAIAIANGSPDWAISSS